jgi:hypothetical protein
VTPADTATGFELATMVAVPAPTAVTVIELMGPSEEIEATVSSVVIHSTLAPIIAPFWSLTVATTVAV